MYSIHLQFADLEIGEKFQFYCNRIGIYCSHLAHHCDNRFHVETKDLKFFNELKEFASEHDFLDLV